MSPQEVKTVADLLIADFENEIPATLRVIEAVPNHRLDYRPDAKSKTGLGLIRHIALEDAWLLNSIAKGEFAPPPDDSDACGIMTPADASARREEGVPAALHRAPPRTAQHLPAPDGRSGPRDLRAFADTQ